MTNFKQKTRNKILGASIAVLALALGGYTSSFAAAANPGTTPGAPASQAASQGSAASDTEYAPQFTFISPAGHAVVTYDPMRSPRLCRSLFAAQAGNSYAQQGTFWSRCILGYTIK